MIQLIIKLFNRYTCDEIEFSFIFILHVQRQNKLCQFFNGLKEYTYVKENLSYGWNLEPQKLYA